MARGFFMGFCPAVFTALKSLISSSQVTLVLMNPFVGSNRLLKANVNRIISILLILMSCLQCFKLILSESKRSDVSKFVNVYLYSLLLFSRPKASYLLLHITHRLNLDCKYVENPFKVQNVLCLHNYTISGTSQSQTVKTYVRSVVLK